MNAPKESGSCNVSELCPWGRSQGLGEEPGVRGGEKVTFVHETKLNIQNPKPSDLEAVPSIRRNIKRILEQIV